MVWWVKYMVTWSQNVIGKISWCHFDFPFINREYWALWEERTLRRQKHSLEDYSDYLGYIPWLRQTWTGTTYLTSRPRSTARVWLSNSGGEIPVTVSTKTCHLETWSSKRRISRLLPRPATPSSCSSKSSLLSYSSESWIYSSGKRKKKKKDFSKGIIFIYFTFQSTDKDSPVAQLQQNLWQAHSCWEEGQIGLGAGDTVSIAASVQKVT